MKIVGVCSGAGGIEEGLFLSGYKTNIAIEINPVFCKTLKLNHPDTEIICGDFRDYINSIGKIDYLVGGVPCQPFSNANRYTRTFDTSLLQSFFKMIEVTKPQYFLLENVVDIQRFVLDKNHYIVNVADYGVPQIRKRLLVTNIIIPSKNVNKWKTLKDALGLDGFIEDRKITFGVKNYRRYSCDRPSITIHTDPRMWHISPNNTITKLSINQLQILQSFPTNYKFHGSIKEIKIQIGNAVPPLLIKSIFSQEKLQIQKQLIENIIN